MSENKQELQVAALKNGTVIDHIPSEKLFTVVQLLGVEQMKSNITIGFNLESKKLGKKGIIKVANHFFADEEINKIAIVSPNATIIEIKNFEVVKKTKVSLPEKINGIVKCMNPNCITNHEAVTSRFTVMQQQDGTIKLKCRYCEKFTTGENITFK